LSGMCERNLARQQSAPQLNSGESVWQCGQCVIGNS
jgi:hypothetical protein